VASAAVERRKASAPVARTDGNVLIRVARAASADAACGLRAFRRFASLHFIWRTIFSENRKTTFRDRALERGFGKGFLTVAWTNSDAKAHRENGKS
jgi:hypothetical protein